MRLVWFNGLSHKCFRMGTIFNFDFDFDFMCLAKIILPTYFTIQLIFTTIHESHCTF